MADRQVWFKSYLLLTHQLHRFLLRCDPVHSTLRTEPRGRVVLRIKEGHGLINRLCANVTNHRGGASRATVEGFVSAASVAPAWCSPASVPHDSCVRGQPGRGWEKRQGFLIILSGGREGFLSGLRSFQAQSPTYTKAKMSSC